MPEMQSQSGVASSGNGASTPHDLFALTDEQILEIEPESQDAGVSRAPLPVTREEKPVSQPQVDSEVTTTNLGNAVPDEKANIDSQTTSRSSSAEHATRNTVNVQEPPPWLAAQMKDPWNGQEAKELWNGVQQAKSEAAAYRAAFATPEDARELKELYPGGVNEARAAAERARVLDDIDGAYFGVTGKSAQEVSASRAQLAQTMLRESPVAANQNQGGLKSTPTHTPAQVPAETHAPDHDARVAAYASFEKAANDDLERSVGATIERTLQQALPNASRVSNASGVGTPAAAGRPLQARLSAAIRQDVEAVLKGDRQLSEQVAQILSGRRLDEETRGQVVRLIGERAQQLVPVAAKRVLNDWTQTTLSAHRGTTARADAASSRREVAPASSDSRSASLRPGSSGGPNRAQSQDANRGASRSDPRRVDYRKLSDEQILDL